MDMTQNTTGLGNGFSATLVCPKDRGPLYKREDSLECGSCGSVFPLVRGVPILINDENSVFAVADYVETPGYEGASYARDWDRVGRGRRLVRKIFKNFAEAPSSLRHLSDMEAIEIVRRECPQPRILVVGSGGRGHGGAEDRITAMDVAFGPGVEIIADAHDLPFPDGAFDLVIAIAVLEHVASELDPVMRTRGLGN